VVAKGHEHGLLAVIAGPNVLRLLPPLIIENRHVDTFIERLSSILAAL
jgi:acetylornithine/N-succinyldiaminopimelate aminotransferase